MPRSYFMPGLFIALSGIALILMRLPGTADVNVWHAWVNGLQTEGFISGFNAGVGHILQPPLGMLILYLAHAVSPWLGVPVHVWPESGWTGYDLTVWFFLVVSGALTWRITRNAAWGIACMLALTLSAVYGYFDLFGIPFFLGALHLIAERRWAWAYLCFIAAALIKWQFLVFSPFVLLFAARELFGQRPCPWKVHLKALAPSGGVLVFTMLLLGPGSLLSLMRGLSHDTLSGYALNTPWLMTWAMHLRWPESYGPLENGMVQVLRTQDTRVLGLVRILFCSSFLFALWRQWRQPHGFENLLRFMLAGYLAYFLFNKGVHENHLIPAIVLAGYLAWQQPQWRIPAIAVAVAANLNLFFFYTLKGVDRGNSRVVLGLDTSLPLAVLYVLVLGMLYLSLCGLARTPGLRGSVAPKPDVQV